MARDTPGKEDVPPRGDADGEVHEEDKEGDAPGGASGERVGEQADLSKGVGEDEGEMRKPRVGRRPALPTKAEIEEHFPLHLHYRSWCRHCRAGKARLAPHLVEPANREKLGVTFSADYAFMTPEEADEQMQPSLIMYDDSKEAFWATWVRSKGVSEAVVKYVNIEILV